jgi:hypothetical protein
MEISLAIASSSPRYWLDSHLRRVSLLDEFDVIAAGDEVMRCRPGVHRDSEPVRGPGCRCDRRPGAAVGGRHAAD